MATKSYTLTQIYEMTKDLDLTPDDLLYIVDKSATRNNGISKALTLGELVDYLFKKNDIIIGSGDGSDVNIAADLGLENNPIIRYNFNNKKWQFSNDGINFVNFGSGSTGSGIKVNEFDSITELKLNELFNVESIEAGKAAISLNLNNIFNSNEFVTNVKNIISEEMKWNSIN